MYLSEKEINIVREIQTICADIHEFSEGKWNKEEASEIAMLFNTCDSPFAVFRHVDEKTGGSDVGYKTRDGREWFHILRQMRNTPGSGLLENLGK